VLPAELRPAVADLAATLAGQPGVEAVVLGGSWARGRARPESDVDLGVLYREARPFDVATLRAALRRHHAAGEPEVSELFAWGPFVNGGAWLVLPGGRRADVLYRSVEQLERALSDAAAGRYTVHFGQQPPFGFFSPTLLGELAVARPLSDPGATWTALQARLGAYPEPLRRAVVQGELWAAEFALGAFAPKAAAAGDAWRTAGCLARVGWHLVLALFALHRTWLVNDKTALAEIVEMPAAPPGFGVRLRALLAEPGSTPRSLGAAVDGMRALVRECVQRAGPLYTPPWRGPVEDRSSRPGEG